jgi:hypothetical protein
LAALELSYYYFDSLGFIGSITPNIDRLNTKDLENMRKRWNGSFDKLKKLLQTPEIE